jgi:hypothetical protein
MAQDLWSRLGTDQGISVLGFILSSVFGGLVTYFFQRMSWQRQARLDLYSARYKEGSEFLERLSSLIDRRYFALKRFIWAIEEKADVARMAIRESEYFKEVVEWNNNLRTMHNRVRILIGEDEALAFLDYEDDYHQDRPRSLHYRFILAHRKTLGAKSDPTMLPAARQEADKLNWCLSSFLFDVTTLFTKRANSLTLLRFSDTRVDSKTRYISGPPSQLNDAEFQSLPGAS